MKESWVKKYCPTLKSNEKRKEKAPSFFCLSSPKGVCNNGWVTWPPPAKAKAICLSSHSSLGLGSKIPGCVCVASGYIYMHFIVLRLSDGSSIFSLTYTFMHPSCPLPLCACVPFGLQGTIYICIPFFIILKHHL